MTTIGLRLAVVLVTASFALRGGIPIYPGATLDVQGMKLDRENDPSHTNKLYVTGDSFEKVYTFYQNQKGATEEKEAAKGNAARGMKLGVFQFKEGTVALMWPSPSRANSTTISVDTSKE
ncbi:MAG TPA: hypothetical protein VHE78_16995 [Gemmatimonadaceae bacterium]|nr:hypothetical protein [Gemmatimonadaceae bacterium]